MLWIGFISSIMLLIVIARKSIWLGLLVSSLILGLFSMSVFNIGVAFIKASVNADNLFLCISMALIPLIGGLMEDSGQMDDLVNSIRINKAAFNALAPALVGLLPVAGGALISAPMVNRAAQELKPESRCALNVWFRHTLFLIYPVGSTLILSAREAGIDRYMALVYLSPFLLITIILGYIFFLRPLKGKNESETTPKREAFVKALIVILVTPILDISLKFIFPLEAMGIGNLSLLIGVVLSTVLSLKWSGFGKEELKVTTKKAKPWNFFLFMLFIFFFLEVFYFSGIDDEISSYNLSPFMLLVVIGFAFGFITGRINVPLLIIIPLYMTTYTVAIMSPLAYVIAYMSVYYGYAISPVHPCVSATLEYFNIGYGKTAKMMLYPTIVAMAILVILSFLVQA
ncbi:MAG: DUF401 family protein [Candidatus Hodarchaeota archaeon]